MADTPSRMADLKAGINELAGLAAPEHRERAGALARSLNDALETLPGPAAEASEPAATPPRAPRDEVERCPICTLRSFRFQRGTIRESEHGGFEALYRCGSCAHEGWQPLA